MIIHNFENVNYFYQRLTILNTKLKQHAFTPTYNSSSVHKIKNHDYYESWLATYKDYRITSFQRTQADVDISY